MKRLGENRETSSILFLEAVLYMGQQQHREKIRTITVTSNWQIKYTAEETNGNGMATNAMGDYV